MEDPQSNLDLLNVPGNFLSRIEELERMVTEIKTAQFIPPPEGVAVDDLRLWPDEGVTVTDPTSTDYTGGFACGEGIDFGGIIYTFGYVKQGVIQWGGRKTDAAYVAGAGAVVLDADGIGTKAATSGGPETVKSYKFIDAITSAIVSYFYGFFTSGIVNAAGTYVLPIAGTDSLLANGSFAPAGNNAYASITVGVSGKTPKQAVYAQQLADGSSELDLASDVVKINSNAQSGTNTGNVTLTTVGSTPSASGASLSGQALTLQPADATHPGVMTAAQAAVLAAQSGTNTGDDARAPGWTPVTWANLTRTSATTFTTTDDITASGLQKGDKLKFTDTTTKYLVVYSISAYAGGVTTITTFATTDYAIVGNPSAMSYSHEENPVGWPGWFSYAVTRAVASGGTAPTYTANDVSKYFVQGKKVVGKFYYSNAAGGTPGAGAGDLSITLPCAGVFSGLSTEIIGSAWSYEAAGTIATVNISPLTTTTLYFFTTAGTHINGNDQSSTARIQTGTFMFEF